MEFANATNLDRKSGAAPGPKPAMSGRPPGKSNKSKVWVENDFQLLVDKGYFSVLDSLTVM
jgi:hypothetical protein